MKLIPLYQQDGSVRAHVKVDDEDYPRLASRRWYLNKRGYPASDRRRDRRLLHREVLNAPPGTEVDHRNGDKLDAQRENLRLATRQQNGANRSAQPGNTSGHKGVGKHGVRWRARIMVNHKDHHLGVFDTAAEAAEAYAIAAKKHFGEFATLRTAGGSP